LNEVGEPSGICPKSEKGVYFHWHTKATRSVIAVRQMNTVITGTAGNILIDLAAVLLNIWQVTNTTLGPEAGDL
jgi:hypothetical protein